MKLATAAEMRALDAATIERAGMPAAVLMENAGADAASWLAARFPAKTTFLCVCGTGNNGGDGLVVARHLVRRGRNVAVLLAGDPARCGAETKRNAAALLAYAGIAPAGARQLATLLDRCDVVIDALLGTGTNGAPRAAERAIIDSINESGKTVIALDLPSGLVAGDCISPGPVIRATATLTFGVPKLGMQTAAGREACGRIIVHDIFFPAALGDEAIGDRFWTDAAMVRDILPGRALAAHKGRMGRVLVIAGSIAYPGAARLAALGALAGGPGLVHLALPAALRASFGSGPADVIVHAIGNCDGCFGPGSVTELAELANTMDAVVLGPGIGRAPETRACVQNLVAALTTKLFVDADGIRALALADGGLAVPVTPTTVLTPHPGELAALGGHVPPPVDGFEAFVAGLSVTYGCTILAKDASSLVATPAGHRSWIASGHPALARGGSGDVLAGYIGALAARGLSVEAAATAGAWLHGTAARLAARRFGQDGVTAQNLASCLALAAEQTRQGQSQETGDPEQWNWNETEEPEND